MLAVVLSPLHVIVFVLLQLSKDILHTDCLIVLLFMLRQRVYQPTKRMISGDVMMFVPWKTPL